MKDIKQIVGMVVFAFFLGAACAVGDPSPTCDPSATVDMSDAAFEEAPAPDVYASTDADASADRALDASDATRVVDAADVSSDVTSEDRSMRDVGLDVGGRPPGVPPYVTYVQNAHGTAFWFCGDIGSPVQTHLGCCSNGAWRSLRDPDLTGVLTGGMLIRGDATDQLYQTQQSGGRLYVARIPSIAEASSWYTEASHRGDGIDEDDPWFCATVIRVSDAEINALTYAGTATLQQGTTFVTFTGYPGIFIPARNRTLIPVELDPLDESHDRPTVDWYGPGRMLIRSGSLRANYRVSAHSLLVISGMSSHDALMLYAHRASGSTPYISDGFAPP